MCLDPSLFVDGVLCLARCARFLVGCAWFNLGLSRFVGVLVGP